MMMMMMLMMMMMIRIRIHDDGDDEHYHNERALVGSPPHPPSLPLWPCRGRVTQFMKSFASPTASGGMTWSALTSCVYLDLLHDFLSPVIAPDGTRIFAAPMRQVGGWWGH
jgi:hypothetical protein